MTDITKQEKKYLLATMASKYQMEPAKFEQVLRATVVPAATSNEHLAAFLLVANEYNLNPITKEIYAFEKRDKNGINGIQPIVSVDGWIKMANNHPECDGWEYEDNIEDGKLVSITCRIYRKDRSRPVSATEYMSECRNNKETWVKWPARMLRHKALIQAIRQAFGFSAQAIMDEDEYQRILDVTPPRPATSGNEAIKNILKAKAQKPQTVKEEIIIEEPIGLESEIYTDFDIIKEDALRVISSLKNEKAIKTALNTGLKADIETLEQYAPKMHEAVISYANKRIEEMTAANSST